MKTRNEMTRGEFFRCCAVGACSLAAVAGVPAQLHAEEKDPEAERFKGELDGARTRYAGMVSIMDSVLDEPTKERIFNQLGRNCAQQFRGITWEKYRGDFQGYLQYIQGPNGWCSKAEYDEKNGVVTITDKAAKCTCPLVKPGVTSASQCLCTLGWQEETYSRLLGKPVKARIVKSILRGDDRCVFRIEVV